MQGGTLISRVGKSIMNSRGIPKGAALSESSSPGHWLGSERVLPVLAISLTVQLVLGLLLGHAYDMRLFMAAGYQVASGENPYLPADLTGVFHNATFSATTTVGYPPPWPLLLGAIYRLSYANLPSFLLYNLAVKVPIILANVGLACLTVATASRLGADKSSRRAAWMFMLLNPFLLYASAAWGQFDSIVTLLVLASLLSLASGFTSPSAILLALAISFKPTPIPLLLPPLFFLRGRGLAEIFRFYGILGIASLVFWVGPFLVLGWDPSPILNNWNAHFVVGGGMSPLAALELSQTSYRLPGSTWLVGLLWVPALGIASYWLRDGITGLKDLIIKSVAMIMVFFLTRAWLSEPNVILVLPFLVILAAIRAIPRWWLHVVWILPLLFGIVNVSAAQLFFPSFPYTMEAQLRQMEMVRAARLVAKVVIVLPWQILGWSIVVRFLGPHDAAAAVSSTSPA